MTELEEPVVTTLVHRRVLLEDQRDSAIAHDGGAGEAVDAAEIGLQALDDHLVLADELVYEQRDAPTFGLQQDEDALFRGMDGGDDGE